MTVGLVIVSHSAALAAGIRELAGQMAPDVTIATAGGTDDGALGTSFDLVTAAFADADTGDGVVVLYDLGSAFLTTETALELAEPEAAGRIVAVDAPLVEGAVAAAVAAQSAADLAGVAGAARAAGNSWTSDLCPGARSGTPGDSVGSVGPVGAVGTATVLDDAGIHARPAGMLARTVAAHSGLTATIGRPGEPAVDLADVLGVLGLGLRSGEEVELHASGPGADDAVDELASLIDNGLDG